MKPTEITLTTEPESTSGYMKILVRNPDLVLVFKADEDFRGTLARVSWFQDGRQLGMITDRDFEFVRFKQVGQRPEIEVDGDWLEGRIACNGAIKIRFDFRTFRQEPTWYANVMFKLPAANPNAAYIIGMPPKPPVPENTPVDPNDPFNPDKPDDSGSDKPYDPGNNAGSGSGGSSSSGCNCDHEEITNDEIDGIFEEEATTADIDSILGI